MFPRVSAYDMIEAVIATTSGGLVGGDQLEVDVSVGRCAQAMVTTPVWLSTSSSNAAVGWNGCPRKR